MMGLAGTFDAALAWILTIDRLFKVSPIWQRSQKVRRSDLMRKDGELDAPIATTTVLTTYG